LDYFEFHLKYNRISFSFLVLQSQIQPDSLILLYRQLLKTNGSQITFCQMIPLHFRLMKKKNFNPYNSQLPSSCEAKPVFHVWGIVLLFWSLETGGIVKVFYQVEVGMRVQKSLRAAKEDLGRRFVRVWRVRGQRVRSGRQGVHRGFL
jgi:hypothetical protein